MRGDEVTRTITSTEKMTALKERLHLRSDVGGAAQVVEAVDREDDRPAAIVRKIGHSSTSGLPLSQPTPWAIDLAR